VSENRYSGKRRDNSLREEFRERDDKYIRSH